MKKRNIIMAAAAAMAMAAGVTTANAATITQSLTQTTATSPAAQTSVQKITVNSTAAQLKPAQYGTVTMAIAADAAAASGLSALEVNDTITITVSGAKFNRATLGATPVSYTGAGAGTAKATWILDATDTILTGTVTKASAASVGTAGILATNMVLAPTYDLTGVASGTDVTIASTVSRTVLGQKQVIDKIAATATNIVDVTMTPALHKFTLGSATSETATVASNFVKLDSTSANATATTLTVPVSTLKVSSFDDYNVANSKGTILLKLSGVPANATQIAWAVTNMTQSDANGAAPATATAGGNMWLDGAGNAFATLSAKGTKLLFPATAMTITLDGKAAVSPTSIKLSANYVAGTGDKFVSHAILAPTTIASIVRNGSSFAVNSSGPKNTIKITDMSGALTASTGKISVIGYAADGTVAPGTAPVILALPKNGTRIVAMSALTAAFPTAVRFDFTVESTEILASNVKVTASGTTVSTYRNALKTTTGTVTAPAVGTAPAVVSTSISTSRSANGVL